MATPTHAISPGLTSPTARQRATQLIMALFTRWQLNAADQLMLLGMHESSRSSLMAYQKGTRAVANRPDALARVGMLFEIHASLRTLFPHNPALANAWMATPNADLGDQTPLDIVRSEGLMGLNRVAHYLENVLNE